jgi:S-DNA-T family DNA segregation ATPase FtsK/SpoIIIE
MAEKKQTELQPAWRADGVVLVLFAVAAVLATATGTAKAISGGPNALGEWGDFAAGWLVDPLGWAAFVLLAGWFAFAGHLVFTRSPLKLAQRFSGWLLLAVVAAVGLDWFGAGVPEPTVAGRGGSVGAYLRFALEDSFSPAVAYLVFATALAVGAVLAADVLVLAFMRGVLVGLRTISRGLLWLNDRTGDVMAAVLIATGNALAAFFGALVPKRTPGEAKPEVNPAPAVKVPKVAPVPVSVDTPPPIASPLRLAEVEVEEDEPAPSAPALPDVKPEDIPIHVHAGPKLAVLDRVPALTAEQPSNVDYELPPLALLNDPEPFPVADHEQKLRDMAVLLEKTFQDFSLNVRVVGIHTGPVITQYEIALETGMRLNKVTSLADDLALNLGVQTVRVVAPLPGRNTVGIEVPNEIRQTVHLKELVTALAPTPKVSKFKLPLFVGKDVEGRPLAYDLATMPHLLIAGSTGTGKSVCLNTIIVSLLLTRRPDECRMILIDPKKVELSDYAQIPHLMTPVVKEDKKADAILAWAVEKMEERYEWLHRARVRNIATYNELPFEEVARRVNPDSEEELRAIPRKMPYIVIVIDEVGDLMMKMKKEIEGNIILLAQKSRAAGIHLILATQRPTVDVVTGLIKSNMPARICFRVTNRSDSAVVLDEKGGERLLGKGDMLLLQTGQLTRAQGALVDDKEIERVTSAIATDTPNYDSELLNLKTRDQQDAEPGAVGEKMRERDPIYEQAVEIVIREQRGSTSLLQRALGIGYGKASRLIDFMAEDGIVGGFNGSNARQVLISPDEWHARKQAATA